MSEINYQMIIKQLASQWRLTEPQYQRLLALDPDSVTQLIAIENTLQQLFTNCPMLAELWMTTPNKAFGNVSPMTLIEQEGRAGLEKVVQILCLEE